MWVFFLLVAVESACPTYICASLGNNICTTWTTNEIKINSSGCADITTSCSLAAAQLKYKKTPESGTYECTSSTSSSSSQEGFMNCGDRQSNKSLESGSHPKKCTNIGEEDESCLLEDGTYSECACGMDGKSYCKPSPSDTPFDDYWSECDKHDNVVNALFFNYYDMMHSYYIEYETTPDCGNDVFTELVMLDESVPDSDDGRWIIVGCLIGLIFI